MKAFLFFLFPICCSGQLVFEKLDRNSDGKITKDELPQGLRKNFERVDQNKDGLISKAEHQAFTRGRQSRSMKGIQIERDIDYVGKGNVRQMLDVYRPENVEGDLPVICWIHGGGWQKGTKSNIGKVSSYLHTGKYAVVSVGYRLTDEAQWPAQIYDCKAAIRFVRANAKKYGFDAARIAVAGSSAGGHLVTMLGVTGPDAELEGDLGPHLGVSTNVSCVVDFFGPKDLVVMDKQGSRMNHNDATSPEGKLIGGKVSENVKKAKNASPRYHVSKDDAPILIFHGTKDPLVPYQQSVAFEKAFEKMGGQVVLVTVTDAGHGNRFGPSVEKIMSQFLENALLQAENEAKDVTLKAGE